MFPAWDELYRTDAVESLPWYWPTIDPDLEAALDARGIRSGRALDLGTGPGTQALAMAERGLTVTAADVSPAAIDYVRRKASARKLDVTLVVDDVLATKLTGPFDVVFDRGCFHVLPPEKRAAYVGVVEKLVARGGWMFLKTFSHLQPGDRGPYRFTPDEIRGCFASSSLEVVDLRAAVYQGTLDPYPQALFTTLRKA